MSWATPRERGRVWSYSVEYTTRAVNFLGTTVLCNVVLVLKSLIINGFICFRGGPGHRGFVYLSCWRLSIRLVPWRTSAE